MRIPPNVHCFLVNLVRMTLLSFVVMWISIPLLMHLIGGFEIDFSMSSLELLRMLRNSTLPALVVSLILCSRRRHSTNADGNL